MRTRLYLHGMHTLDGLGKYRHVHYDKYKEHSLPSLLTCPIFQFLSSQSTGENLVISASNDRTVRAVAHGQNLIMVHAGSFMGYELRIKDWINLNAQDCHIRKVLVPDLYISI